MADGGGFLQGLHDWLLGTDPAAKFGADPADANPEGIGAGIPALDPGPPVVGMTPGTQGVLSKLGNWVTSPEGMLAIGTTLRAGTGNENAFQDQARIQQGWATAAENARKLSAQQGVQQRYKLADAADPTHGAKFRSIMLQGVGENGASIKDIGDFISTATPPAEKTITLGDSLIGLGPDEKSPHIIATAAPKPIKVGENDTMITPPGATGPTLYGSDGKAIGGAAPEAAPAAAPPMTPPGGGAPIAAPQNVSPVGRTKLAQMIAVEAGNQPLAGKMAVGAVALNRLAKGYGGATSLEDVIDQPGQFEGMKRAGFITPKAMADAQAVADQLLSGQGYDPTNGADHFLNPVLQKTGWQGRPGMAIPDWASVPGGQQIGDHVFFGGQAPDASVAGAQASATAPSQTPQQAQLTAAIPPVKVASAAEAAKLPPNRQFVTPDGRTMWSKGSTPGGGAAPDTAAPVAAAKTGAQPGVPTVITPEIAKAEGIDPKYVGWTITKGKGKDAAGAPEDAARPEWKGLTGPALLAKMPQSEANQVQALAEGRMAYPTGKAAASPYWQERMAGLALYDPSFDQADPQSRVKARVMWTQGKMADTRTSMNTLVEHAARLEASSQALGNLQDVPFAANINALKHGVAKNMQSDALYKTFETDRKAVADEAVKALRGTTGARADVQDWMNQWNPEGGYKSNHASTVEIVNLMASKLNQMQDQYRIAMGRSVDPMTFLSPRNQALFKQLGGDKLLSHRMANGDLPVGVEAQ
jgi:hypothetical protein